MRRFSKSENEFIKALVNNSLNSDTFLACNLFDGAMQSSRVRFVGDTANHQPKLIFYYHSTIPTSETALAFHRYLAERLLLIKYLQAEGLMFFVNLPSTNPPLQAFGYLDNSMSNLCIDIDRGLADIMHLCMNLPVFVSQTLIDYVGNGFKSIEEQTLDKAKQQTEYARKTFYATIITVFITIITFFLQTCCSNKYLNSAIENSYNSPQEWNEQNISVPIAAILGIMKNSIEPQLEATMNNTADIHMKLCDTINVKMQRETRPVNNINKNVKTTINNVHNEIKRDTTITNQPSHNISQCIKKIEINTCKDTVVPKYILKSQQK